MAQTCDNMLIMSPASGRVYRTASPATSAVVVVCAYIAAQMLADIASLRIVLVAGLSVDAGTFVYPLTFTLRDLLHRAAGVHCARVVIVSAAVINVFMAVFLAWVGGLQPDPGVGPQTAFAVVFAPVWRIVVASIIAEVASELVDTEVYAWWTRRVTARMAWTRVWASNGVSVPLDSVLFVVLAFAGTMPVSVIAALVMTNVAVKYAMTVVGAPLIYAVRERGHDLRLRGAA